MLRERPPGLPPRRRRDRTMTATGDRPEAPPLGTRASPLARTQTATVAAALEEAGMSAELVPMTSEGDHTRASLASLGGTGVFAARLRQALLAGQCDEIGRAHV